MRPVASGNLRPTFWCRRCGTLASSDLAQGTRSCETPSDPDARRILRRRQKVEQRGGLLAYVIGPYRAETREGILANVQRAALAAVAVLRAGHTPLCPHTMTDAIAALDAAPGFCDPVWIEHTLLLLERCDLAVCIPGWKGSAGSRREVDHAKECGIPVRTLDDLTGQRDVDAQD